MISKSESFILNPIPYFLFPIPCLSNIDTAMFHADIRRRHCHAGKRGGNMNRLVNEKSAYLRHAAQQKIDWHPWSEEVFEKAAREDKPVFLSSGAIWCHWCHVMAKESFDDDEVAAILNEHYVAVKIDRDERPDIDRRYQQAVAVMGQGGGWPLSMFLTPDKEPFFGGTYFPPVDKYGMPGFKTVLMAIKQYYKENRNEVRENGRQFLDALKTDRGDRAPLSESVINEAVKEISGSADKLNGGFGNAPKFPMSGAIEFLLGRCFFSGDETLAFVLKKTLKAMADGGFRDQIGGGFHRYSTDNAWGVPHFEKMADDNAWLLRNYCDAYSVFGEAFYKEVAEGIIAFVNRDLSHPDGGFYASMDADVTPDDEGGYFTWTDDEFRQALTDEEYGILSVHLFNPRNTVHHDPAKVVLSVRESIEETAKKAAIDPDKAKEIITRGKEKLLAWREKRERPFVDNAIYTSINGMMISAYCRAYRAFGNREILDNAVKGLEKIMQVNVRDGELYHSEGVRATLDDYVFIVDALLSVYEATGDRGRLSEAKRFMDLCIERFGDRSGAGFFDTQSEVIGMRLKGIEDIPRPSANAQGILVLLKLAAMCDDDRYHGYAKDSLEVFIQAAAHMGIHGGYFFCALDAFYRMAKLDIHAIPGSSLADAVLFGYYPYSCTVYGDAREDRIIPCIGTTCFEPVDTGEKLREFLKGCRIKD